MATKAVSTAGMFLACAVETTAGVRPTTGYLVVPEVKSMPDFGAAPQGIDTTILLATKNTTSIPGLSDYSSALDFGVNYTDELIDSWKKYIEMFQQAVTAAMAMWWAVVHPKLRYANYFPGEPAPIGMGSVGVNAVAESSVYIFASGDVEQHEKPTLAPETEQAESVRSYLKDMGLYPADLSARSSKSDEVEV